MQVRWRIPAVIAALCALGACEEPTRVVARAHAVQPPARDAAAVGFATDLGNLGGSELWARSINDNGVAMGVGLDASGATRSWVSRSGGMMTVGPQLWADGAVGALFAINDAGEIAGERPTSATSGDQPFVAEPGGQIIDLPAGAYRVGGAYAINSAGDAAGWYAVGGGSYHAAYWPKGGQLVDLGTLGGSNSWALGMNDRGEVVGYRDMPDHSQRGFYWSAATGMIDVGNATIVDINNHGVAVGDYMGSQLGAFTWTMQGGVHPISMPSGIINFNVAAINDNGIFVGSCFGTEDGRACAGSESQGIFYVSEEGEERSDMNAVNDHNVALGTLEVIDGRSRAVEWQLPGGSTPTDATPPVVTPTLAGTLGLNGWYTSDVALTWSENDPESGVASTSGCDPVTVSQDAAGASFTCSATNGAGLSATGSVTVKRDATPPVVAYSGNAGSYTVDQTVAITCAASDATSGLASSSCANVTGDAYTFPLGTNSFSASASDVAGNSASASTSFTVIVTPQSLAALTQRWVSNAGVASSLDAKLQAAASANPHAKAGAIGAYVNELQAQSGKTIAPDKAAILESLAAAL